MARLQYNYKSQSLSRNVNITVILPTDGLSFYDPSQAQARGQNPILKSIPHCYQPGMKFQTVYVYHGGGEDDSMSARYAAIERVAQENKVMLVCPDIQFFGTDSAGGKYFTYLTEELPRVVQTMLPSSPKREDNFVMGYAMGGNVALGVSILRPELFSACLDISGGIGMTLDTDTLVEELAGDHFRTFMPSYQVAFGQPENFPGSFYDLYPAAKKAKESGQELTEFTLVCGSEEFIRTRVEKDVARLRELGYPIRYFCPQGYNHDWRTWEEYMARGLSQLLPLKREYLY